MTAWVKSDIKPAKKLICLFMTAVLAFASLGCEKKADNTQNGFIVPESGIEYVLCRNFSVYAVNKGKEYIKYGEETVYEVEYEDSSRYLCVEDSGEFLVYRNAKLADLSVGDFNPIAALIYNSGNTRWIASFFANDEYLPEEQRGINTSQDTELCRMIARSIEESDHQEIDPEDIVTSNRYFIRLLSKDYPGLYYSVIFFGDVNGNFYLRDRSIGKTVVCPKAVVARMIGDVDGGSESV